MLDIGWQELLIILVIALVVIGPRDLPKVVRTVGQWTGKARSYARDFQRTIEGYADESDLSAIQKEIAEANKELKEVRRDFDKEGKKLRALEPLKGLREYKLFSDYIKKNKEKL